MASKESPRQTGKTTPAESEPGPASPVRQGTSDFNELRSRIAEDGGDEFVRSVIDNWQKIVGVVVLVLLGYWLFGEFQSAERRRQGEASERFEEARRAFHIASDSAGDAEVEGEDAAVRTFRDNFSLLQASTSRGLYPQLAPVYLAAASLARGDSAQARAALSPLDVFEPLPPAGRRRLDEARFVAELGSLVYARVLVSEGTEWPRLERYLSALARNGLFVSVEALVLMARLAEDEAARESVRAIALEVSGARPEFGEKIRVELANAGVGLP